MGKRFFRPFLFAIALIMVAFSTNLLPVTAAKANSGRNPAGNNGFVKVNGTAFDDIPNNEPHVGCTFRLEFYNYDLNSGHAQVNFELQSPTKGAGYTLGVTGGNLSPYIGSDINGGSNDLDADESYKLNFTGQPQQNQGYHVKLTVTAQGTNGNNTKHKVFWVQPCANPIIDAQATSCVDQLNNTGQVVVGITNPNVTNVTYTVTLGAASQTITLAGMASQNVTFHSVIPGTYTVTVTGNNNTQTTSTVTVASCPPLKPTLTISDQVCSDPFNPIFTGEAKITVHNPNSQTVTYSLTLGGVTKTITLAGQASQNVTFAGLQNGNHSLTVTGSDDTNVQVTVVVPACPPAAPQIVVEPVSCTPSGQSISSGALYITNPNSYSVTYNVTVAGNIQTITVAGHGSGYILINGLGVGLYTVTVVGNNNTQVTLDFVVDECPTTPTNPAPGPGQTLGTSTTRTVTTLPKTGANGGIGLLLALLAASVTYAIVLAAQKRRFATASNK